MKTYIGTKIIKAKPITNEEYYKYRGWDLPEGKDPNEFIYLVEYPVDPKSEPNHPDHEGYIFMSPKHVFDKAYKIAETYIDRLIIEKNELSDKYIKLCNALDNNLIPESAREILTSQKLVMQDYLNILIKRIG